MCEDATRMLLECVFKLEFPDRTCACLVTVTLIDRRKTIYAEAYDNLGLTVGVIRYTLEY